MPRPKRSKVVPSAPTAVPYLQKTAALATKTTTDTNSDDSQGVVKRNATGRNGRGIQKQVALMSGAQSDGKVAVPAPETEDADLDVASDKENAQPERVPSSMPEGTSIATAAGINVSKVRGTPSRSLQRKGSQLSSALHRRTQATPGRDSSMLSLGNFKRRSRQPSLLGIGNADETPSLSLGDSLGDGLSAAFDDLDDFQPQDESTPLHAKRLQPQRLLRESASSTPAPASRKRKLASEVQIPQSPQPHAVSDDASLDMLGDLEIPATGAERDEAELPSPKRRAVTPPADSTMAPPQSSPTRSDTGTTLHAAASKRPTRAQTSRQQAKSKPLSTATLQDMLPKRRAPANTRGAFEISSSDGPVPSSPTLPSDNDELSFAPGRHSRRAAASTHSKALRPTAKQSKVKARATRPVKRTYGRRSRGEEGENAAVNDSLVAAEDEDEDMERGRGAPVGRELPSPVKRDIARMAAKFKAIDDWEMEFEDVSGDMGSSSPNAR